MKNKSHHSTTILYIGRFLIIFIAIYQIISLKLLNEINSFNIFLFFSIMMVTIVLLLILQQRIEEENDRTD